MKTIMNETLKMAYPLLLLLVFAACRKNDEMPGPAPEVLDVYPRTAPAGALVIVTGKYFDGKNTRFNFGRASGATHGTVEEVIAEDSLLVKVPLDALTGRVSAKVIGKKWTDEGIAFTVNNNMPWINYISDKSVARGTEVKVAGLNLKDGVKLFLGEQELTGVTRVSADTLKFAVPNNGVSAKLTASLNDLSSTSYETLRVAFYWNQLAPSPNSGTSNLQNAFVIGNKIYMGFLRNRLSVFDLNTKTWVDGQALPPDFPARIGAVALVLGSKAYIGTGSASANGELLTDWWEFDPANANPWRKMVDFPYKSAEMTGFIAGGKIHVGYGTPEVVLRQKNFSVFDPAGNGSWSAVNDLRELPLFHKMVSFTIGNDAYIGGGFECSTGCAATNKFFKASYNGTTLRFTPAENFPVTLSSKGPQMAASANGYGFVILNWGLVRYHGGDIDRFLTLPTSPVPELIPNHLLNVDGNRIIAIGIDNEVFEYVF